MLKNNEKLMLAVSNIAIEAGNIIMDNYNEVLSLKIKKDKSPLTKADIDSNNFIIKSLFKRLFLYINF